MTWASVFPLDVIKTRLQSPDAFRIGGNPAAGDLLLQTDARRSVGTADVARQIYRQEGLSGFFRGFGVCSVRAFIVNAVQVSEACHQQIDEFAEKAVGCLRVGNARLEMRESARAVVFSTVTHADSVESAVKCFRRLSFGSSLPRGPAGILRRI